MHVGHEADQEDARVRVASRNGYSWNPFKIVEPEDAVACHTTGAPFAPRGWLHKADKKLETCHRNYYKVLTATIRQITRYTGHVARPTENLAVSLMVGFDGEVI